MNPVFEYKGFQYVPEKDYEDDNVKIFHTVKTPDGKEITLPYSPYATPDETNFKRWVDMGCPLRDQFKFNLSNGDIEELWENKYEKNS